MTKAEALDLLTQVVEQTNMLPAQYRLLEEALAVLAGDVPADPAD